MLPLAAPLAAEGAAAARAVAVAGARFTPMAAPTLAEPEAMATTRVGSGLEVRLADGSRRSWTLAYRTFFVTGERVPDGRGGEVLAGGCHDIEGRPIIDRSVPGRERQFFSDCPDGMTLLALERPAVAGVRGNAVFAVVQFEYVSRDARGRRLGHLRLLQYRNVDTAGVGGLWTTCGASLSPWNTHLSSEEYPPDATAAAGSEWFRGFSRHLYGDPGRANPYRYGHVPEVTVHPDGSGSVRKHYCMGRISHEVVKVMPDSRTVLMGDDWDNGGLFMFVAERAGDLSAGALYVARWEQVSGKGPGAARLSWIRLGAATSAEIEALVDRGIGAAQIMDVRTGAPDEPGFTRIAYAGRFNWVRLAPGMDKAAAFLETHRTATRRCAAAASASPRWRAPPSTRATASPTSPSRASSGR